MHRRWILFALVAAAAGCRMKKQEPPCAYMAMEIDAQPTGAFAELGLPPGALAWCRHPNVDKFNVNDRLVDMEGKSPAEVSLIWHEHLEKHGWRSVTPIRQAGENLKMSTHERGKCGTTNEYFLKGDQGMLFSISFCAEHGSAGVTISDCKAPDAPNFCKAK